MADHKQEQIPNQVYEIEKSNKILFLLVGFLLGFIVCFVFTTSKNSNNNNASNTSNVSSNVSSNKPTKLAPVTGSEAIPANHPKIDDLEKQIKEAINFGNANQDFDSQLKVGSFLYSQARMMEQAKPFLLKAQQLKPQQVEPLILLANLCFDQARQNNAPEFMQESIKWFEKAIKVAPDNLDILTDLGVAYQYISPANHQKALQYFDKTLSKNPKHIPALYNKTRSYISLENLVAAQETLKFIKTLSASDSEVNLQELIDSLQKEITSSQNK